MAIPRGVAQVGITICVLGAGLLQNVGFFLFQGNISVCAGQMSELKETTDIQIMGNQTKHTAPHYERKKKNRHIAYQEYQLSMDIDDIWELPDIDVQMFESCRRPTVTKHNQT